MLYVTVVRCDKGEAGRPAPKALQGYQPFRVIFGTYRARLRDHNH